MKQNSEGHTVKETNRGSETVSSNQRSQPFYLEDSTGRIEVNPEGAQLDTVKVLEDFRPEEAGGMIAYGGFSRVVDRGSDRRRTLGYRYRESILPINQRAMVLGMISDHDGHLRVQKPTDSANHFIVSLKDAETLTQAADSGSKHAFYGMVGCLVAGIVCLLIDVLG